MFLQTHPDSANLQFQFLLAVECSYTYVYFRIVHQKNENVLSPQAIQFSIRVNKNITIIHDSSLLVNCLWSKSCVFARNKSIINTFELKRCFQLKYKSFIHNISAPSEKVMSELGEKYAD